MCRLAAAILIAFSIWTLHSFEVLPNSRKSATPPFRSTDGEIIQGSIAQERMVTLGGWNQYILLRGEDRTAPILVFLHGGPGTPEMPLFRRYNSELEKRFVVVHWEQRGAGRSYSPRLDPSTLTLSQFVADLDELVEILCREFHKTEVVLMGHSWGTELGMAYASHHPEKIVAYISIGQQSDVEASEAEGYEWVLEQARIRKDSRAIRRLESIGPPPYPLSSTQVERRYLWKYGGAFYKPRSFASVVFTSLLAEEISVWDLLKYNRGQKLSLETMWPLIAATDVSELYPSVDVPVFFILGRHDRHVSSSLAAIYFNRLDAPYKELIWFERSAHNPPYEEPEKFNEEILRIGGAIGLWD